MTKPQYQISLAIFTTLLISLLWLGVMVAINAPQKETKEITPTVDTSFWGWHQHMLDSQERLKRKPIKETTTRKEDSI